MGWSVPYVAYRTCVDCVPSYTVIDHGRANPLTLGIGLAPSYRSGRVTYFGGLFARNHPTTQRKQYNVIDVSEDGDVHSGPFNVLLHVGVEIELQPWLGTARRLVVASRAGQKS